MNTRFSMFLLMFALAAPLSAQQSAPPAQRVDRIYAVVGDSIIFESEINEEVERMLEGMRSRGETVPTDSAQLARIRNDILDQVIDRLVLLQAALRDSVLVQAVDETALNEQIEREISERRQRMGGQAQFDAALKEQRLTLNEYRDMLLADLRKQTYSERLLQKFAGARKPPPVSDKELKDEFEKAKSTLPPRPPTITFQQVVMLPRASDDARARARAKADSLLALLRLGANFDSLATRNSDDPGSKELGGLLGWSRPAMYVKEFADAIMYLRPGNTSPVVETQYGYHIIKLEKVRGPEVQVRHILVTPASASDDFDRALARGKEVADKIRAGADVDSMHRAVGDVSEKATRLGPVDRGKLNQISPEHAANLSQVKQGDVVGPFAAGAEGNRRIVIVKVQELHEGGQYTIDDPVLNFRRSIQQRRLIDEIIDELRRQTYIEIRK
ncbi:MAG: peptidylprolyl isomerase [Longimicrobiales bacterium]